MHKLLVLKILPVLQCDIKPLVRSGYNVRVTLIESIVGSNTHDGSILMNNATHQKSDCKRGEEWREKRQVSVRTGSTVLQISEE